MNGTTAAVRSLRTEYLEASNTALGRLTALIHRFEQAPAERGVLGELLRTFHHLAGSGGTFGFPEISETAARAERLVSRLLLAGAPPERAEIDRLAGCAEDVGRLLGEALRAPAGGTPGRQCGRRQREVLLVTGEEAIYFQLARIVALLGWKVRWASGFTQGRREVAAGLPDLMVVASDLPDGSGHGLVGFLREQPEGDQVPAYLVAAHGAGCDQATAIYSGADGVFQRPIDWSEVTRQLVRCATAGVSGRILAVEDDPWHAAFIRSVLEPEGYEVRCCADPALFTTQLEAFRPHLVLMDVLLPGVSGYELVRTLRRSQRHAALPVLFLTAQGQIEDRIQAVAAGGDNHLVKPVPRHLLLQEVKARVARGRAMQALLEHDGLTGLLTHAAFIERARTVAAAQRPSEVRTAVWVMIDFDHFKSINDRFGHPAGDRVLAEGAALLRRHVRRGDAVGRYGGEELCVLFADVLPEDVERLIDRLRQEFSGVRFEGRDGNPFCATWSAGVAALRPGMSWQAWREEADQALYRAKTSGRNRVELARERRAVAAALPPAAIDAFRGAGENTAVPALVN